MKLKIKFKYECQLDINEEEAKKLKEKLELFRVLLNEEVNKIFLQNDGRTEAGSVTDFEYEVE